VLEVAPLKIALLKQQAIDDYQARRYAAAQQTLEQLKHQSGSQFGPDDQAMLAWTYYQQQDYRQALTQFKEAYRQQHNGKGNE
jgi:outer membrane protein assembly factor BamD (BamD/ComL family)